MVISWLDIVTSVLGLTCVVLAGRNSKYNFWVGYLYTFALALMFFNKHLYASLFLQPISLCINILGHWRWTHPRVGETSGNDTGKLRVSALTWPQRGLVVISVFALAGLWGWLLENVAHSDPVPYLDACVTSLILLAQLLSALKKWDCWVAWLVVNATQIVLHIKVGHVFMPIVCGLYLLNGVWSLYSWKRTYNKGE